MPFNFLLLSADAYAEAIYAIRIAEGIFFKLNPDEGFSNFPSGYLHPFIYALLYKLSFSNKNLFIFYIYIFNTLILILSIFVIKRFYEKFFKEKNKAPFFLLLLSPPFIFNFFLTLNFPLYVLFFYLSLYFIDNNKKFVLFFLPLIFTRPEGAILIVFYFIYKFFYRKNLNKGNFLLFFLLILLSTFPFLINKILTGYVTTLAVRAQSIFNYYDFPQAIFEGFKRFLKHLFSMIIGSPFLNIKISEYLFSLIYPPFFLIFAVFYIFKSRENFILNVSLFFLFILILFLDSFTYFTGIHFSRHIAYFYPVLILFFYKGIRFLPKIFLKFYIIYFSLFFLLFSLGMKHYIKESSMLREFALKAGNLIPKKEEVLVFSDPYFFFYNMDRLRIRMLSPSFNPLVSRYTKNFKDREKILYVIKTYYEDIRFYYLSQRDILKKDIEKFFPFILFRSDDENFLLYSRGM